MARGANVKGLQRMRGHASAKHTLDTYTDLLEDDLDGVVTDLDEMLAPTPVGKVRAKYSVIAETLIANTKKAPG